MVTITQPSIIVYSTYTFVYTSVKVVPKSYRCNEVLVPPPFEEYDQFLCSHGNTDVFLSVHDACGDEEILT